MNDWPPVSARTLWYAALAAVVWSIGVLMGIISKVVNDPIDLIGDAAFLMLICVSLGMIVWSARQCPRRSALRRGWMIVGLGFIAVFIWTAAALLRTGLNPEMTFNGAGGGLTLTFILTAVGLSLAASSTWNAPVRRQSLVWAAGVALALFALMTATLLAPGPSMPFSYGPRDSAAIGRIAIDSMLVFLPVAFATLAQLKTSEPHRARAWVWASIGALMIAMGDVINALVDLGRGQIYPVMMWTLGLLLLTVAASITADFERAKSGLRRNSDGRVPESGLPGPLRNAEAH